jgi:hypothetical protein
MAQSVALQSSRPASGWSTRPSGEGSGAPWQERTAAGLRYLVVTAVLVAAVGAGGWWLSWPLLTSTVGPTAYVFVAHHTSATGRVRNAMTGHGIGVVAGLGALSAFGLLHAPSESALGAPTLRQIAAAALAVGVTVFLLELLDSHHAPAAASALLVSSGLARPGRPLIGLVVGLAVVIALGPLLGRWPIGRRGPDRQRRAAAGSER